MRQHLKTMFWAPLAAGVFLTSAALFGGCGSDDATTDATSSSSGSGGAGGEAEGSGGGGAGLNCVVDGVVTPPEQCDDGNSVVGDGCENDCSFTCTKGTPQGDEKCDDLDPCNGAETCTDSHTCAAGAPLADGADCGNGKVCKAGVCGDITCGDTFVVAPEECDDGNVTDGDGCDDCAFSCLSTDPTRDCSGGDPCQGAATCDDSAHVCVTVSPLPDGAACSPTAYCSGGVCTPSVCGNGDVEQGEICDDGNPFDGDGCDVDCTVSCVDPLVDCPAAPTCEIAACSAGGKCTLVGDAAQDGMTCGASLVCSGGACVGAGVTCGDGAVGLGEACDFGAANGPGTGCEYNCKFSCTTAPDSCPDADPCSGVESCAQVTVGGATGQACQPGSSLSNCSACPGSGLCVSGLCKNPKCGDTCLSPSIGEECEPPGSPSCDLTCHFPPVCGNGLREPGENCDDGNTANLDGCDSACKFEQDMRVNYLQMQFGVDAFCTLNALGAGVPGVVAQGQLQTSLDAGIQDGSIALMFRMLGLDDLTGTSDAAIELGVVAGSPDTLGGALVYDGNNDLDWWHNVSALSVDANLLPTAKLAGSIAAKVLTAGPGNLTLNVSLAGSPAALNMSAVRITTSIGATSAPLMSSGNPPGHLASENLDPALVSYASAGQKTLNGAGELCGNVSALSLAQAPIPASLTGGGLLACSENYAVTNTMLDLFVGGCTVLFIQQIKATQPDQVDPSKPAAGGGGPYKLSVDAQKSVTGCKDKNNATADLQTCLTAAAYSSFFKLAMGRVIFN